MSEVLTEHDVIQVGEFEIELYKTERHAMNVVSAWIVAKGGKGVSLDNLERLLRFMGTWEKIIGGLRALIEDLGLNSGRPQS